MTNNRIKKVIEKRLAKEYRRTIARTTVLGDDKIRPYKMTYGLMKNRSEIMGECYFIGISSGIFVASEILPIDDLSKLTGHAISKRVSTIVTNCLKGIQDGLTRLGIKQSLKEAAEREFDADLQMKLDLESFNKEQPKE